MLAEDETQDPVPARQESSTNWVTSQAPFWPLGFGTLCVIESIGQADSHTVPEGPCALHLHEML